MDEFENDTEAKSASESNLPSIGSTIEFKVLASLLEQINLIDLSSTSTKGSVGKNEQKKRLIQKFIEGWRTKAKNLNSDPSSSQKYDDNFFPVMRMLLPGDDRRVYGLKETKLGKYLIEALSIAPKSQDAQKLMNYRAPQNVKSEGDFASVAYFVLKNRCIDECKLSIDEVNKHLDNISINNAKGKEGQKEVNNNIQSLIVKLSALQLKWLIRIILKDLKIGIKEHIILDAYHPDAMELYNFSSSLEKVCSTLNDPTKRLNEVAISIFSPCRPMLGEKTMPNKIEELLGGEEFYIETKYDGERFQLHKKDDLYKYFSRNGHDFTDTFGTDIFSGSLTPYIHNSFNKEIHTIILDGEMCNYDSKEKILLSMSDEYDVKSSKQFEDIQTCFCIFDILLYNDIVLTNKPLKERLKYMKKAINPVEGRVMFSHQQSARTNQEAVDALNKAIDSRLEGIVVKNPNSVYKPSVRSGSGWFKIKPDYMTGLNDDLDLLIVGGYYGSGRRSGILSHFLLAVALDDEQSSSNKSKKVQVADDDDDELNFEGDEDKKDKNDSLSHAKKPEVFYSFCKIGSGYTLKELLDFNQKLSNKMTPFDKKNPPKHLQLTYEKPDTWIEPKDSFIVQVKAVEINPSDKYKTGCTLRFPRLEKFRSDKEWYECMKLSELNELMDKNEGKLASKHFELNDDQGNDEPQTKKKRTINRKAMKKPIISSRFKGIDASSIDKIGNIFEDKEFCVIMGNDSYDKPSLEKLIAEYGGTFVQNPGEDTFCIITSKLIHKINAYINKDQYDVVKIEWILKCIENKKFTPLKPSDMLFATTQTKHNFNSLYDKFGDSYSDETTVESLKNIFSNFDWKSLKSPVKKDDIHEKIAYFENKYFPDQSFKFGLFRLNVIYVDLYKTLNKSMSEIVRKTPKKTKLDILALRIRWKGGRITKVINNYTTHCIIDEEDTSNLIAINEINSKRAKKFHIVSSKWVEKCIKESRLIKESPYYL